MEKKISKTYQAAIYLRLSKEDGDVDEGAKLVSNSISNQKALIMDFLKSHAEIKEYSIYVDDGYSGVSFDRPDFQRMLDDIRKGVVNCVIVKDLSRFGRNYIEAGRYIEKIFPMLGVRFIAVTDGFDSIGKDNSSDLIVPFKNLINDAYSRDISIKIRSNLEMKRKRGEYIGAFLTYGYLKSEEDKNKIVVDSYAAEVVKDIFRMKISGMGQQAIADKLNAQGILSPLAYKNSIGIRLKTSFGTGNSAGWNYVSVTRVLKNEIYTGTLIQGKHTTPNYKIKARVDKPEEEWVRVGDNHEAIITPKDFALVQELLKTDTRRSPAEEKVYPLAGKIFCGDCMEGMVRKTVPSGGRKYVYYVCSGNKKQKGSCSPHSISEKELMDAVLEAARFQISTVLGIGEALSVLDSAGWKDAGIGKYEERIRLETEKKAKTEGRKLGLYEDFKDGILTKQEYVQMKQEYDRKLEESENALRSYRNELKLLKEDKGSRQEWIKEFKKYENLTALDRNAAATLIRQVRVYEGKRIEVIFNFEEELDKYSSVLGGTGSAGRTEGMVV